MNSPHSSPAPSRTPARTPALTAALRVPAVTAVFWIVKVLTTGVGETTSDFLVETYSSVLMVLFVTAVAVFGTMLAHVTHIVLGGALRGIHARVRRRIGRRVLAEAARRRSRPMLIGTFVCRV